MFWYFIFLKIIPMSRIHKFRQMLKGLENWNFYSDMIRYYRFLKNQLLFSILIRFLCLESKSSNDRCCSAFYQCRCFPWKWHNFCSPNLCSLFEAHSFFGGRHHALVFFHRNYKLKRSYRPAFRWNSRRSMETI